MFSYDDRMKAVLLYIKYDRGAAATVRDLGYSTTKTLKKAIPLGKHPLPTPIAGGVWILARYGIRKLYPPPAVDQILPMDIPHADKVVTQEGDYRLR